MANLWRNVLVFLHVLNVVFEYLQMCIKRQWNKTRYWIIDKISPITATPENDALPAEAAADPGVGAADAQQKQLQVYGNGIGPRIESDHERQRTVSEDQLERVVAMERAPPQPPSSSSSSSLTRNETRRSKSKVRSYLRRCKEVITGHHHSHNQESIDHSLSSIASSHEPVIQRQAVQQQHQFNDSPLQVIVHHEGEEQEQEVQASPQECEVLASVITSCDDVGPTTITYNMEIGSEDYNSVAELVDNYLGHLYPEYHDHTRSVLVRQARDLLLCTYHGNLQRLEEEFLAPGAALIAVIKRVCAAGQNLSWCSGWPLSIAGAVVLHLGPLDESLVRPQDIYLCIRPGLPPAGHPQFSVAWYAPHIGRVSFRALDPTSDGASLGPIYLEAMLAEELPQLLQTLLVGVERVICRLPLDDLSFPSLTTVVTAPVHNNDTHAVSANNASVNSKTTTIHDNDDVDDHTEVEGSCSGAQRRPVESGLKRRELITKNKMMGTKYALLRAIKTENSNQQQQQSNSPQTEVNAIATLLDDGSSSSGSGAGTGFGLGGGLAFPHIDSDEEESADEAGKRVGSGKVSAPAQEVTLPRSIADIPERLLLAGIYLPGLRDRGKTSIIAVDGAKLIDSQLTSHEVATILLYYTTIPTSPVPFTIHVTITQSSDVARILGLLDESLSAITTNIAIKHVIVSGLESDPRDSSTATPSKKLPKTQVRIVFCTSTDPIGNYIGPENVLGQVGGSHEHHNQLQWIEYFAILEPLQSQCISSGKKLVTVMGDIRNADIQGVPSRRQLHSQHRALSRALMDAELQGLRRKGPGTISRLQERAKLLDGGAAALDHNGDHIRVRLAEAVTIFGEVDRAAKRLEHLTEQRRECLREMTRQRALEDEINDVLSWLRTHGEVSVSKYMSLPLDCSHQIKDHEQEFEKFYFVSMKHLAKGRDLHEATLNVEPLRDSAASLNQALETFSGRLEVARERIEGATRLHHLFGLQLKEEDVLHEMQRLAEKIGKPDLLERFKQNVSAYAMGSVHSRAAAALKIDVKRLFSTSTPERPQSNSSINSQPNKLQVNKGSSSKHPVAEGPDSHYISWMAPVAHSEDVQQSVSVCKVTRHCAQATSSLESGESPDTSLTSRGHSENSSFVLRSPVKENDANEEDEEDHSKMADSGLGGCDRCEGQENIKLNRACSCQSFEDATMMIKSNDSDDMDEEDEEEDDEECFGRNGKDADHGLMSFQPNSHLFSYSSNLNMDLEAEVPGIDQKTQKTLLLIMREMIGTERDYVRSLHYIIENYTKELLREDIPQALRGQRNVIFGNVERIYEFHQQYFLGELESCEKNPLKVGAAFLRHESKFYLYALYNKNKPKSDSLMSEYGTSFFKSKQLELNDKMDLASYLLKPVQRMGKYALLLQQLMKACNSIQGEPLQYITEDVEELQKAEEMVRFQLRHGNDLLAQDSLRDCDVNVKEQGRLLRQNEFLVWQGKTGKKSLRQVFLFEELVLFSKARRFPDSKNLDIYIYKNSIKTSDIGLTAHVGDATTKFEIWFRKRKRDDTWTLQSMSEDIKNSWTDEFSRILWMQARKNREIRLLEMSSMGIGSKPCLDIRPSQNQINDRSISFSQMAPKFRNSFMSSTSGETIQKSHRPNSIISVNSLSSGTSSSSGSCSGNPHRSSSGVGVGSSMASQQNIDEEEEDVQPKEAERKETQAERSANKKQYCGGGGRKGSNPPHHRSTRSTLVSQCSMESGIIDDISTSPDEVNEIPSWSMKKLSIKQQQSLDSDDALTKGDHEHQSKANQSPSGSNPYINESLAVHL